MNYHFANHRQVRKNLLDLFKKLQKKTFLQSLTDSIIISTGISLIVLLSNNCFVTISVETSSELTNIGLKLIKKEHSQM